MYWLNFQKWRWNTKIIFEKMRLESDDRYERPIIIFRQKINKLGKCLKSEIFICLFDFNPLAEDEEIINRFSQN